MSEALQPIVNSLTTSIKTLVGSSISAMSAIIPEALTIMGVLCVVGIGVKTFKSIAK